MCSCEEKTNTAINIFRPSFWGEKKVSASSIKSVLGRLFFSFFLKTFTVIKSCNKRCFCLESCKTSKLNRPK